MFRAMSVKALSGWVRHWNEERWGDVAAGLRTGMLALSTGEFDKGVTADRFVVATPTPGERKDREEHEEALAEWESWRRS